MPNLRADAAHNRAELLDVARQVIAEQGVDASLRDIARQAGVGIGTLYRHFPTREALIAELVGTGTQRMAKLATELAATEPPGDALATWLTQLARRWAPYKGMPGSLMAALENKDSELGALCGGMATAGQQLFAAAQAAGAVRADVTWDEVFTAVTAVSWAAGQSSPERADRILAVYLDGLKHHSQLCGHIEFGEHLGRPQADDQLTGDAVALAELLRLLGAHVAGGDHGCGTDQLAKVLGQLRLTLHLDETERRFFQVNAEGGTWVAGERTAFRGFLTGVEHEGAVLHHEPDRRDERPAAGGQEAELAGAGALHEELPHPRIIDGRHPPSFSGTAGRQRRRVRRRVRCRRG